MIKASLKSYRQSPRKVRLVANLIKGRSVLEATDILKHLPRRAAEPILGVVESAIANASNNFSMDKNTLIISDIRVEPGAVLKRSMPRARGSAFPIKKRTSHILVVLDTKVVKSEKAKSKK